MATKVIENSTAIAGEVQQVTGSLDATTGSVGLETQVPGNATTVSGAADATNGIAGGNFIETDIDAELFKFNSDDTPLMQLMLKAKKVKVKSPEVEHYQIDEPRYYVTVKTAVSASSGVQAVLTLEDNDAAIPRPYTTLLVKGVDGYDSTGQTKTPGKDLMLFVIDHDATSGNPIVRAINGPKGSAGDEYCKIPAIPKGTQCILLGNALYETQKEVDPDLIVPQPTLLYLQKRGMNQIVSDYFDAQKKRIPFSKSIIAEAAISNFKTKGNRTLWAGRQGKFKTNVPKMGMQYVYTTEGVRWQFKRELQNSGTWTVEKLIALAKMFFTGEDVPKTALLLAGKNLLEKLQCIDYSKHPEIQISTKVNPVGWEVTNIHTVFGDIQIKREPTLDRLGWSNSGALIGEDRLVHYTYSTEHSFNDRVEGEEATRTGILVWDALALKGSCHIWIDGETSSSTDTVAEHWKFVDGDDTGKDDFTAGIGDGDVIYLIGDAPSINVNAVSGTMWQASVTGSGDNKTVTWAKYTGTYYAS